MRIAFLGLVACTLAAAVAGCHHQRSAEASPLHMADHAAAAKTPAYAISIIQGTKGHQNVGGVVRFTQTAEGVRVLAEVVGLEPNSKHGFHLHEYGDLSDMEKGASLGSHFDPEHTGHHGKPTDDAKTRHGGDMGNLTANESGKAYLEVTLADVTIGGKNSILGRGVVVHEKLDDFGQPVGNAGGRIGVGVIGAAKGPAN